MSKQKELPDEVALVVIMYNIRFDVKPNPMFDAHITVINGLSKEDAPMSDEKMRNVTGVLAQQLNEVFGCEIAAVGVKAAVLDDDEQEIQNFVHESMDVLEGQRVLTKWEGLQQALEKGEGDGFAGAAWEDVTPGKKGAMKA